MYHEIRCFASQTRFITPARLIFFFLDNLWEKRVGCNWETSLTASDVKDENSMVS